LAAPQVLAYHFPQRRTINMNVPTPLSRPEIVNVKEKTTPYMFSSAFTVPNFI
jgi:hypothetical protein